MGDDESDLPDSMIDPIIRVVHFSKVKKDKDLLYTLWHLTDPKHLDGMRSVIKEYLAGVNPYIYAIIAYSRDTILGWASLDIDDEDSPGEEYFNINVYVDEKYRGRGIGRKLTKEAQNFAGNIPVKAYPQDKIGNKLYKKSKFELVNEAAA